MESLAVISKRAVEDGCDSLSRKKSKSPESVPATSADTQQQPLTQPPPKRPPQPPPIATKTKNPVDADVGECECPTFSELCSDLRRHVNLKWYDVLMLDELDIDAVITPEFLDFWSETMRPTIRRLQVSSSMCSLPALIALLDVSSLSDLEIKTATGIVKVNHTNVSSLLAVRDLLMMRSYHNEAKTPTEGIGEETQLYVDGDLAPRILERASDNLQVLHLLPVHENRYKQHDDAMMLRIVDRFKNLKELAYTIGLMTSDLLSESVTHLTLYMPQAVGYGAIYQLEQSCPNVTHLVLMTFRWSCVKLIMDFSGSSWSNLTHLELQVGFVYPESLPPKVEIIEYYGDRDWNFDLGKTALNHTSLHTIIINNSKLDRRSDIKRLCLTAPNVSRIILRDSVVVEGNGSGDDDTDYTVPSKVIFENCIEQ
jgi:hypothetical protein